MSEETYGGALGAFPYAARASSSWSFRVYVGVAALVGAGSLALFLLSLVGIIASTANQTASVTLVRAFLVVVWLAVVVPVVAPVLLVARRHRLDRSVDPRYDSGLATAGYLFLAALYVGLLASVPPDMQQPATGPMAGLVEFLYGLPQLAGVVPPLLAAAHIWVLHRMLGDGDGSAAEE